MQKQNPRQLKNGAARAKKTATRTKTTRQPKGLAHHTKRIIKLTPMFVHGMVTGAFIGVMVLVGIGATGSANALSISSPRDCDSNAVISCGALTTNELKQRYYNSGAKGVAAIYKYFSISGSDIDTIGETAVAGRVYKNGRVTVNNVVVATEARTVGRENIAGSTKVKAGGTTFYTRAPSVSFNPNYINAFVVMQDGQFKFAILGACGNPVSGKPIPKKTPPVSVPKETPPVVTTVTPPSTQTPPSKPQPKVTVAAAPQPVTELPKTGPNGIIMVASLAVIGGYLFHITHHHVKRRRRTTH
jgi:hypothetical protein